VPGSTDDRLRRNGFERFAACWLFGPNRPGERARRMIDRDIKRSLGQMMKGVEVVSATHDGVTRAYCSHWVSQVSFEEPIVLASISPKHDTHPLLMASGRFAVSLLAADQVDVGQYFSYPGRKFRHLASEHLVEQDGWWVVPDAIAWLGCEVLETMRPQVALDHDLVLARVVRVGEGRLREPPLLYSSRQGWRRAGDRARQPGDSVRDRLLERLAALGVEVGDDGDEE
jgi:flavin reductase (DIM6/NTAB) family NADH-FMN oxidoreductase RutF